MRQLWVLEHLDFEQGSQSAPAIALEASSQTLKELLANCIYNHERFTILHRALSALSGERVAIHEDPADHASTFAMQPNSNDTNSELVETITIADLAKTAQQHQRYVVKLDVEGQEIPALSGGSTFLENDVLLYYEDHGSDRESKITEYVLTDLGWLVYYVPKTGNAIQIMAAEDTQAIKKKVRHGYNFAACKADSDFLKPLLSI